MKDPYTCLGVERSASPDAIKKAYRKLAMKFHPDRNLKNPKAEEQFKDIQGAYAILSDPEKKLRFDQLGAAGFEQGHGRTSSGPSGFGEADFSDLFSQMFGQRTGSRSSQKPNAAWHRAAVQITLEEAFQGCERTLSFDDEEPCNSCKGTGSKSTKRPPCKSCGGTGQAAMQGGFFTFSQACPSCDGTGIDPSDRCPHCKGHGTTHVKKTQTLRIPKGALNGSVLKIKTGSQEILLEIHIAPHPTFEHDGADLHSTLNIPFVTAALGGVVSAPTLEGTAQVTIPPGSQQGQKLRLKGLGLPKSHGRGDLFFILHPQVPQNLTDRQKEILRQFEAEHSK